MKAFCFTVDDNIRFFKEICEREYSSIFDHPYLDLMKRLHERFDLKVQLNLFYRMEGFDLSMMSEKYADEWRECADWLKLSFHSELENVKPYKDSSYSEVFSDCERVNREILRFASDESLARTTTLHYCVTTEEGVGALYDNGVRGLLGLFGDEERPRSSYSLPEDVASRIRAGETVRVGDMAFASIDMIVNNVKIENIIPSLTELLSRDAVRIMIHEQYFYRDYAAYQPDFERKLITVFNLLCENGYKSRFFESLI